MDPFRNPALHNAKLQSLLSSQQQQQQQHKSSSMPPPPAYHMVVDPHAPIPNIHSPYDVQEEDEKDDDDTPEITINAATQIRGHGNIISIAQMDSIRIANLVAVVLNGGSLPQVACPPPPQPQPQPQQAQQQRPQSPTQTGANAATEATPTPDSRQEDRLLKQLPKINITINCGATVLGDRNIVGPGLGDIARHMQWAQRNQAQHAQQQQQQQQQHQHQQGMNQRMSNAGANLGAQYQTQAPMGRHGLTPPMSRSSSFGSEGSNGVKRKAPEDAGGQFSKRQC